MKVRFLLGTQIFILITCMTLSDSINKIPKVGLAYTKKLEKMGVKTIQDLLFYFPYRYEDFSNLKNISQIKINETVCIQGEIIMIENQATWKRKMLITKAVIKDKTGAINATWFNQPYITKNLKLGDVVCLAGKVSLGKEGVYLSNPIYEKVSGFRLQASGTRTNPHRQNCADLS